LRAGIYAERCGLKKIRGLGAKTKAYYRPTAIIREYIAFLAMHKKAFAIVAAALLAGGIGFQYFLEIFSERFVI
jgi:hypothetical protein